MSELISSLPYFYSGEAKPTTYIEAPELKVFSGLYF